MPMEPVNPVHLQTETLSLGCPVLDRLVGGGVPCGSVTEIAGEAASGKTQLCLQLLLSAAAPRSCGGLSAASLFISSEPPFPLRRLLSLSASDPPLDHILVGSAFTPDELLDLLKRADKLLSLRRPLSGRPIRLLVLDSAAALFRSDAENAVPRSGNLFKVAVKLKEQARRFNIAVIVTNHVVDVFDGESGDHRIGNYMNLSTSGRRVWPAMGLAWANCVNTRLFLSRTTEEGNWDVGCDGGGRRLERKLQVVYAPHLPETSGKFVIGKGGVFGVAANA